MHQISTNVSLHIRLAVVFIDSNPLQPAVNAVVKLRWPMVVEQS